MTDVALQEPRTRISATTMEMSSSGQGGMPMPRTFGEVIAFADVMSRSQHAIPAHLRANPGACLAVTMQALRWEMDPFAVAAKTYYVKDQVAYEAQVIAAVVNVRSGLTKRPSIEFKGQGASRQCVVTGEFADGQVATYESPRFDAITTKNSPLWKSDPDQQLGYYSIRSFARRHCPEVILGVYDRDELQDAPPLTARAVPQERPNLAARLAAPQDAPREGFNTIHGSALDEIDTVPEFDAATPSEPASDEPASEPPSSDAGDTFPGDDPAPEGERTTAEAIDVIAWADALIRDLPFMRPEQVAHLEQDRRELAKFAVLKVTDMDKARELERAIQAAKEA